METILNKAELVTNGNNYADIEIHTARRSGEYYLFTTYHINEYGGVYHSKDLWIINSAMLSEKEILFMMRMGGEYAPCDEWEDAAYAYLNQVGAGVYLDEAVTKRKHKA